MRKECAPDGRYGREWLRGLVGDLADDELVETTDRDGKTRVALRR